MRARRILPWMAGAIVIVLLSVSIALAFGIGDVDGVWQTIDGGGGADCDSWGTVDAGLPEIPVDAIGAQVGTTNYPLKQDQTHHRLATVCSGDEGDATFAEWDSNASFTWTGVGSYTGCTNATSLIFSQYGYDSRIGWDHVVIEIYNGTGAAVDLSEYSLRLYTSSYQYTTVALGSVSLGHGDVYVLVNDNAASLTTEEDQTFTNSEDYRTIVLVKEGTPSTVTAWSDTNPGVQTPPDTDENQVRYGEPASTDRCPVNSAEFLLQSGFGFDGVDATADIDLGVPFYLGTFTHYNNPIFAGSNPFDSVDLTLAVPIDCDDNGSPDTTFTFNPNFALDETPNSDNPCQYPDGPNTQGCADQVLVSQPPQASFNCGEVQYTVNILGFTTNEDCETVYDQDASTTEFLTRESFTNKACLWAEIQVPTADAKVVKECVGFDGQDPHYVITVTNLGPGTALGAQIVDTLPNGVTYASYTSQLTLEGTTTPQGTCTADGQTVTCDLNSYLLSITDDDSAKWVVDFNVDYAEGTDLSFENTVTLTTTSSDPDAANNTSTANCEPTEVDLISFMAMGTKKAIILNWETASETGNLGFNLYRAEAIDGERILVNAELIPTAVYPGSPEGAVYSYEDRDVTANRTYFYWLEDVELNGPTKLHGPVEVSVSRPGLRELLPTAVPPTIGDGLKR